jgi:hypothetical protein
MAANGDALSGIMVVASPERLEGVTPDGDHTRRFWTRTDEYGAYNFCKLPEGEYTIRSSKSGKFRSARTSARTGVDYADLIIPETSNLLASGRVVTPLGEPLEGVTVLPILAGQPSVRSDTAGHFKLPLSLTDDTGSFSIRFQQPGFSDSIVSLDAIDDPSYLSTMEVVMQPVAAWTSVTGQVRTDSGSPLANKAVELRPVNSRQSYRSRTQKDGTFEFPVVEAPADYRLIVYGGAQHKDFEHLLQIHPRLGDIEVVVEPYDVGTLTGQLRNSNGEPVPNFELVLRNTSSREPVALVTTDGYGNFTVPRAPAGSLVISSRSTPHLLVQGLHIASDETQHTELTLDWGGHEIQGTVTDADGLPLPASQIVLKWMSTSADGISSSATRRTSSDSEGRFAFNSLGPGPHILKVSAAGYLPINLEHDLSRQGYEVNVRMEQTVSNRIERALAMTATGINEVTSNPAGSL